MGKHDHDDRNLEVLAVDTQLTKCIDLIRMGIGEEPWEDDLIDRLVQDTGNPQDQDGERVLQHLPEQRFVKRELDPQLG